MEIRCECINSLRAADLHTDSLRGQCDRDIYRRREQLTSLFVLVAVFTCWHNLDLATPLTFDSVCMYKIEGGAGVRSSCHTFRALFATRAMNADQALELVLDGTTDELESGDEIDIKKMHHFRCLLMRSQSSRSMKVFFFPVQIM